jgi:hypothetical protein
MDDYPSNSHKSRELRAEKSRAPEVEAKKIEKAIEGNVIRRKRSLGRKFADTFTGANARTALTFVVFDVLIPDFRQTVVDAVSQGAEQLIMGETRSASRRTGTRRGETYTHYARGIGGRKDPRDSPATAGDPRRRARAKMSFDDIIIGTRHEAEDIISRLFELVERYEMVTVAELYEMVGEDAEYTDRKYGWTDMRGSMVDRTRDGYLLNLPKPELLD